MISYKPRMGEIRLLLLLAMITVSCQKGDPPCGCGSATEETVEGLVGLWHGETIIHTKQGHNMGMPVFIIVNYQVCNPEFIYDNIPGIDRIDTYITFSGEVYKSCDKQVPGEPEKYEMTVTDVRVATEIGEFGTGG